MIQESTTVQKNVAHSMRTFFIVWIGQVVSLSGSELSSFAIGIWVYEQTGVVSQYALIFVLTVFPRLLITPYSGVVTDRFNRRWVMIFSDVGAGVSTLLLAVFLFSGNLQIEIIYLVIALKSVFSAFQIPAYTAATTQLVPKEKLAQASGLSQLGRGIALLLAPVLGAVLLSTVQLRGVIIVDILTLVFALVTLLIVSIPDVKKEKSTTSWWQEAKDGWAALTIHRGFVGLTLLFVMANLLVGIIQVLVAPMVLAFTTKTVLGIMLSIAGTGMLVGGISMGMWPGPKRLIYAVIAALFLNGLWLVLAGLRPWVPLITLSAFLFFCGLPLLNGYSQVIFQKKIQKELQGRVFATVTILAESVLPIAYLIAGPLADRFEPLLLPDAPLAGTIGTLIGTGPGRGIGLLFIIIGICTMIVALIAYAYPRLRLLEDEIPDAIE